MNKLVVVLGIVFGVLGAQAQQVAGTGKTGPAGAAIGYNEAGPNWLYVPVDANGYLMVDCPGCTGGGGSPGGANTQVQINNAGSFGADSTFTFNTTTKYLNFQNAAVQPLGTAISGTNQSSGFTQWVASIWNGTAAINDIFSCQNLATANTANPYMILNCSHTGSSGGNEVQFTPQVSMAGGGYVPSGQSIQMQNINVVNPVCTDPAHNMVSCGGNNSQTALYNNLAYMGVSNMNQRFNVSGFPSSCTTTEGSFTNQLECAWFMTFDTAVANTAIIELDMGFGYYVIDHSLFEPTQSFTGITLKGTGPQASVILPSAALTNAAIYKNETVGGGALPNLAFENFKIQGAAGTEMAGGCMKIWGVQELKTEHLNCVNVPNGAPFLYQFGEPSNYGQGWVFQHSSYDVIGGNTVTQPGTPATITASSAGGNLGLTISGGGSGYSSTGTQIPYLVLMGNQNGTSDEPCSTMPLNPTITLSGTAISTITFGTAASGCAGTIEARVVEVSNIAIGVDLWSTDSDNYATVPLSTLVGIEVHGGNTRVYGAHPTSAIVGIENLGNDIFYSPELDTSYRWGMDFEQPSTLPATVEGASTFGNAANFAVYHFNSTSVVRFSAQNGLCVSTTPSDFHEFLGPTGTVETTGWSAINGSSVNGNDTTCSAITLGDYAGVALAVGGPIASGAPTAAAQAALPTGSKGFACDESATAGVPASNVDYLRCDSVTHKILASFNDGAEVSLSPAIPVGLGAGSVGTNIAIGASALVSNTIGATNVAVGNYALGANTSGGASTALGYGALAAAVASANTAVGAQALLADTSGANNVAMGYGAMIGNLGGGNNVGLGVNVLYSNTSGAANVAIGFEAGYTATGGNANVSGANDTWVGFEAGPGTATQLSNASAFGNGALNTASNQVSLGNSAVTSLLYAGVTIYPIVRGTLTMTTATSDVATVTGATSSSNCTFAPSNSVAALNFVGTYVSAVAANAVTITHVATADSGGTLNIHCTLN